MFYILPTPNLAEKFEICPPPLAPPPPPSFSQLLPRPAHQMSLSLLSLSTTMLKERRTERGARLQTVNTA